MAAGKKEEEKFRVEEWSIDNFSFWNSEIHGEVITSSISFINLRLFPRGYFGRNENLTLNISCTEPINFSGDVSFIGSDGTFLDTQQVSFRGNTSSLDVDSKLKFEEIVTEIRKNRILHQDRLILQFRLRRHKDTAVYRRTIIDVHDASFKISPKLITDLGSTAERISLLQYHFDDDQIGQMILEVSKSEIDYSKIVVTLRPFSFEKNILVLTRMSVLNEEEDEVKNEENECIFRSGDTWTFSNSLKIEEITKNNFSLIVNLKMIPSTKYKQCFGLFNIHPEVVASMTPNSSGLPSASNSKKQFSRSLTSTDSNQMEDSSATMLVKELMSLFQDHDFSDFHLKCEGVSFPVHKNILSARSPVFKTMLSSDMKEAASGKVVIGDLDPSTLARFLIFLYTGTVEDLECDSALKLYYAADKYQVPTLKNECASFLSVNVSISNVGDVLSLSSKHQDDRLRVVAHEFILKNYNEVLGSEEWKIFLLSEPLLVAETLSSLFAEKKK